MKNQPQVPIFDAHNDALLRLVTRTDDGPEAFVQGVEHGHLDLPRAEAGGLVGGIFACFVPSPKTPRQKVKRTVGGYEEGFPASLDQAEALQKTVAMAASLFRIEALSEGRFKVVTNVSQIEDCLASGAMAASLHIEGAEAIDTDLNALDVLYQTGLRSIGPVWSRPNAFGYGVPFRFPSSPDIGPGLTDAGEALIKACNQKNIMIDLSHLNEKGFWDVHRLSDAPLVATHSNAHQLCPVSRNLTDRQLNAIRESDGMVGLNYAVCFLREDGENRADTPFSVLLRHLDYLIEHLGEDRVGLGSDFDGATIPEVIGTAAGLQDFVQAMREHGFDNALIEKLCYKNWLRVLRLSWGH
ncbi:MAG: dipeptidase [Pseudomonadota bacterium]